MISAIGKFFNTPYGSYLRTFLSIVVTVTISTLVTKSPWKYTHTDLLLVANGVWVSLISVLTRWANKSDSAFGRTSTPLAPAVTP